MKKVLMFLAIMIAVFFIVSCSSKPKEPQIVTDAKVALNYYITHHANNPAEFKVIDLDTLLVNDSLCVLNIQYIAENDKGGHINAKGQYLYLTYKGHKYSYFVDGLNNRYDVTKLYQTEGSFGDLKTQFLCAPIRVIKTLEDVDDATILAGADDLSSKYFGKRKNLSHGDSLYYNACILTEIVSDDVPQIDKADLTNIKPIEVVDMSKK